MPKLVGVVKKEAVTSKPKKGEDVVAFHGLDKAGWLSQLLWLWIDEIVTTANREPLKTEHLGRLPQSSHSDSLRDRFDKYWKQELDLLRRRDEVMKEAQAEAKKLASRDVEKGRGTSTIDAATTKNLRRISKPSLIRAVYRTFRCEIWATGFVNIVVQGCQLLVPLCVAALLEWFSGGEGSFGRSIGLAVALLFLELVGQGLLQAHNFMRLYKCGMDLRTILCTRIYEKALTISNSERARMTTGEITNLMSADSEKMVMTLIMFHGIWSTPLFLFAALWLLYRLVGISFLPSLAVLLLAAPLQIFLIMKQKRLQVSIMKISDARVKLVNEILQGIRVVKYYAWERSFETRLREARKKELGLIKSLAHVNALSQTLNHTIPLIMLIVMLVTWASIGDDFAAETVFVAMSLLVLIRFPLIMLPFAIGMTVVGFISIKRIERFIVCPDMPDSDVEVLSTIRNEKKSMKRKTLRKKRKGDQLGTVTVAAGSSFYWASTNQPNLERNNSDPSECKEEANSNVSSEGDTKGEEEAMGSADAPIQEAAIELALDGAADERTLEGQIDNKESTETESTEPAWKLEIEKNIHVKPGKLVAITGRVGSGKTSLLAALLGEMQQSTFDDTTKTTSDVMSTTSSSSLYSQSGSNLLFQKPVLSGSVAYAAQQPWIMNATLRDNILFGKAWDENRYRTILDICCLGPDISTLPAGDATGIGERGINLSGGQKARVGLARAVYADHDVVLLDDVLAAVDAHVGKRIFEKCVRGYLQEKERKTVLLVTNQLTLLPDVDDVVVLEDGKVTGFGPYASLDIHAVGEEGGSLKKSPSATVLEHADLKRESSVPLVLRKSGVGNEENDKGKQSAGKEEGNAHHAGSTGVDDSGVLIKEETKSDRRMNGRDVYYNYFVTAVGGSWLSFILIVFWSMSTQATNLSFDWWLTNWVDNWQRAENKRYDDIDDGMPSESNDNRKDGGLSDGKMTYYMAVYLTLGFASGLLSLCRYLNHANHSASAAGGLFEQLLRGVMYTDTAFFDTTTVGRVLNRFSKDTDSNDTLLPQSIMNFDVVFFIVVGNLVMIACMLPTFIVVLIPVLSLYFYTMIRYTPVSLDLQMLESISRSPIFSQLSETLTGVTTIRAYGKSADFMRNNRDQFDEANRPFFYLHNSNRWLQLRLVSLGGLITFTVAMIIIWAKAAGMAAGGADDDGEDSESGGKGFGSLLALTAGVAGLTLTYTQQLSGVMTWAVRMACEVESRLGCVQRGLEYAQLVPETELLQLGSKLQRLQDDRDGTFKTKNALTLEERQWLALAESEKGLAAVSTIEAPKNVPFSSSLSSNELNDAPIDENWSPPKEERDDSKRCMDLEFRGVSMRYRPRLPLVLRDVNLTIPGGTKVGICGRSGCGKSSLIVALFRMAPLARGAIYFGGEHCGSGTRKIDSSKLPLGTLRRTVGIIPQDPVLFVGTLRDNLDAFGEHDDNELWAALRCACLDTPAVKEQHPGGLDALIEEGGQNWSTGQRQLICLARAVLRNPLILAIDEATANIDLETDAIVQSSIRTKFKAATTLTIAHRLQTILDSDLIITMGQGGAVAECAPPSELLSRRNPPSQFFELVKNDRSAAVAAGVVETEK